MFSGIKDYVEKLKFEKIKRETIEEVFADSIYFRSEKAENSNILDAYEQGYSKIEQDLMKKYFNFNRAQMDILLEEAKKHELNAEVTDTMKEMGNTDKKEIEEVSEKVQEEKQKNAKEFSGLDKKAAMKAQIIKAAVYNRARSYQKEVLKQKELQIENKDLTISREDARKDMREEEIYVKMSERYKRYSGKNLSNNKDIKQLQKKFVVREENLNKGAETRERRSMVENYDLKRIKSEKFEAYIEAIERNDPKLDEYKKDYEEACYNLVKNDPKGRDSKYNEQLEEQKKLEKEARKKHISGISAVSNRSINYKNNMEKNISESNTVEEFQRNRKKDEKEKAIIQDKIDNSSRDMEKKEQYGNMELLHQEEKKDVEMEAHIQKGQIGDVKYKDNYAQTRQTVEKRDEEFQNQQQEEVDDFRSELRENVRKEDVYKAQEVLNEKEKNKEYNNNQKNNKKNAKKYDIEAERMKRKANGYGTQNGN